MKLILPESLCYCSTEWYCRSAHTLSLICCSPLLVLSNPLHSPCSWLIRCLCWHTGDIRNDNSRKLECISIYFFLKRKSPIWIPNQNQIKSQKHVYFFQEFKPLHSSSCFWKKCAPLSCCFLSGIIRSVARDEWGSMLGTCVSRQACCRTPWSTTTWLWSCSGG